MCGITGIFNYKEEALSFKPKVENAISKLHQRGPENSGVFFHGHVVLGHTRLAIIDVSDAASQPFSDISGRYTIIFNGEFFNFKEHRNELLKKGIRLRSQSDTEVLLYLYITEGSSFLKKINGFFALAIYDKTEETLFIARDRFGVKPLFIYKDEEKFIFASELKALLEYGMEKKIDETSLFQYLHLNYIPGPNSIFKNIQKLDPGNFLLVRKTGIIEEKFYEIPYQNEEIFRSNLTYDIAKIKIKRLLDDAVKMRMISDVPLGSFLSGGIDSSVIVALASQYTDKLKTFSIGYKDEPLFDETRYARIVAEKFKTDHTEFILTNDDLFSILFDVLDYTDEPFADSSALAVFMLSKQTRKHVTVALSGDGADELFGGYNKHRAEFRIRNAGLSEQLAKMLKPAYSFFPKSRNSKFSNTIRQLDRFAAGMNLPADERYWNWCGFASGKEISNLYQLHQKDDFFSRKKNILKNISGSKDLNDVLYTDMLFVLQNDMLVKVDRMSMANSLEIRTPFLDYNLVNFVFSLPSEFKIDKSFGKKILQDTFRNILPEEIYHRSKHGFEVPLLKWFRNELQSLIFDDLLEEKFIQEQHIFNYNEIKLLKDKLFSKDPGDTAARIWGLIVFQYWWKKYFL